MGNTVPTSVGRGRSGDGYLNFRENLMLAGAGGPDALQTSSRMEEDGTETGNSDFCGTRSGRRWIFKLPRGFDARGSWRA